MDIIFQILGYTWWFILFLILAPLAGETWRFWRTKHYEEFEARPILLEIRVPREVKKSPKAMEQVLMTMHALRNEPGNLEEYWSQGEITRWFSLEIVSFGGEIHFYIWLYWKYRALVEAAFYSFYPDVELVEVEDYTTRFPQTTAEMYAQGYDLWAGEMFLAKEPAYPIRSYIAFESPDEEKQYDPIAGTIEVLAKLAREQTFALQILIQAAEDGWHEKYTSVVMKLKESKLGKDKVAARAMRTWDFSQGPLPVLDTKKAGEADEWTNFSKLFMRTPGETDVLKAVEENLSKPAFRTQIRFLYFSPKSMFYDSYPRRGVLGAMNQYASLDLNMFKINYPVSTKTNVWNFPFLFPNIRNEYKKRRLMDSYRHRRLPPENLLGKIIMAHLLNWHKRSKIFELNVESIATLFHPPTTLVTTAPHMQRLENRKAGPPAGLAIFGEESEIETYQ